MSYFDYQESKTYQTASFYALIMAAMRRADTFNAERLKQAFPQIWDELDARYNAPGGYLEGEPFGD